MKSFDSIVAARYLLALARHRGRALNATQVQKLLFIAYGYFLAKRGRLLILEQPRAWPYGPVFPSAQRKVDHTKRVNLSDPDLSEIATDEEVTEILERVIDRYSGFTATQLSNWSHMPGSPWERTTQLEGFKWGDAMPPDFVHEYFSTVNVL